MSLRDRQFVQSFQRSTPEQQLNTLQNELTGITIKVIGYAQLLKKLTSKEASGVSPDFSESLDGLGKASDDLYALLDLLRERHQGN